MQSSKIRSANIRDRTSSLRTISRSKCARQIITPAPGEAPQDRQPLDWIQPWQDLYFWPPRSIISIFGTGTPFNDKMDTPFSTWLSAFLPTNPRTKTLPFLNKGFNAPLMLQRRCHPLPSKWRRRRPADLNYRIRRKRQTERVLLAESFS